MSIKPSKIAKANCYIFLSQLDYKYTGLLSYSGTMINLMDSINKITYH